MDTPHGFIRDMLDVKILILFVASQANYPLSTQKFYELCYQDDCLSYFDLSVAIPEMVETGHLEQVGADRFVITEKGREQEALTRDAIAAPVLARAQAAVDRFNRDQRQANFIKTDIEEHENGECLTTLTLNDANGMLMKLELEAPNRLQAKALERAFTKRADRLFQTVMNELIEEENHHDAGV